MNDLPISLKCTTFGETKVIKLEWEIVKFASIVDQYLKSGQCLESNKYDIELQSGQTSWTLKMYPYGCNKSYLELCDSNNSQCNTVCVHLNGYTTDNITNDIHVDAEMNIIDGNGVKQVEREFNNLEMTINHEFHDCIDINNLLSTDNFESLIISCHLNIKAISNKMMLQEHPRKQVIDESFKDDPMMDIKDLKKEEMIDYNNFVIRMRSLLLNAHDCLADVILVCTDGKLACHASILAAGSSYFQSKLMTDMKVKLTGEIEMKGVNKTLCFTLLQFIYTGKVDHDKINLQLFEKADKYGLVDLKEKCSRRIRQQMNCNNCVDILVVADKHSDHNLSLAAQTFILNNRHILTKENAGKLNANLLRGLMMKGFSFQK